MMEFGRIFISIGLFLVVIGVLFFFFGKMTDLLKLPGDILVKNSNFTFYFPIVTSIIISIVLTVIANLFFRR